MEEKTRKSGDLWSGVVLAGLGVYVVVQARQWNYTGPDGPGPGFFPLWYGIGIIVLAAALVVPSLMRGQAPAAKAEWGKLSRALLTWFAVAVSVALCGVLGFLTSFALLTFFITAVLYRRPPHVAAVVAVASAAGIYVVFPLLLGMPLPVGFLGF